MPFLIPHSAWGCEEAGGCGEVEVGEEQAYLPVGLAGLDVAVRKDDGVAVGKPGLASGAVRMTPN